MLLCQADDGDRFSSAMPISSRSRLCPLLELVKPSFERG